MVDPVKVTPLRHGTWLGRPATFTIYYYDKNRLGKRIRVQNWADGGHTIRAVRGDALSPRSFRLYDEVNYATTHDAADIETVVDALAAIHFGSTLGDAK
jgi:hypothetical protein